MSNTEETSCVEEVCHEFQQKPFDWDLRMTKDQLPDPQNFHINEVSGGQVRIQKVGINKLDIPLDVQLRDGSSVVVKGEVSAYVSLDDPQARGINMSRLARCFYDKLDGKKGIHLLDFFDVVDDYRHKLPAKDGYLKVRFEMPLQKQAIREDHMNWIYYPVELEIRNIDGAVSSYLSIDYVYSSACPCSAALAEYSRTSLNTPAISHSQRSRANIKVQFDRANVVWIEDLVDMARNAQPSELLPGVVTRVGEWSFAQLVASENVTGFVEDVLRRFYAVLNQNPKVIDFVVWVDHQESLNQNHANGVIYKGIPGGLS